MNPLALSTVRRLRDEHGIPLDPTDPRDFDRLQRILELSGQILRTQKDAQAVGILRPVLVVGNLTFRRLSIGAEEFLRSCVATWFDDADDAAVLSWAYCHAHGDDPAEIWKSYSDRETWSKMIQSWKRTIGASRTEVLSALEAFQYRVTQADEILAKARIEAEHAIREDRSGSGDWGPLIGILASEYGSPDPRLSPAEYWIWKAAAEDIALLLDAYLERQRNEEKPKGPAFSHSPDSPFMRAHAALNLYVAQIVAEKAKQKDEPAAPAPADYITKDPDNVRR